jgi:hypothetical protein
MADGGSVAGEIVKFDDGGIMIHTPEEIYTNVPWGRFSQDALKQLANNPKIKGFVEPFLMPTEAQRPPKPEIQVNAVTRMERPEPSLFGGLVKSSLGLFLLLVVYAANLFAAYEISIVKARSGAQVVGLSALLPIIGPVIFLILPMYVPPPPKPAAEETTNADGTPATPKEAQIQIGEASWKPQEEKKPEPQIFARGKFTFNKRFIETKFAAYFGNAEGEQAKKYAMELKGMKDPLAVQSIVSVGVAEVILQTATGPVTVPLAEIQEIKLIPRLA